MKKTAAKKTIVKKASIKKEQKTRGFFQVDLHQLPIIVALITVILTAAYVMTSAYIPKQEAETCLLDPVEYQTPAK